MSSVLIGVVDQKIETSEAEDSWNVNKIGGFPSWLNTAQSHDAPKCSLCGHTSSLICQLYCPLGESPYHRCLYIFACLSDCSKTPDGWKVLRSLKLDETYGRSPKGHQSDDWLADDSESWLDDQDDWGEESNTWDCEEDTWGEESSDCDVEEDNSYKGAVVNVEHQDFSANCKGDKCVADPLPSAKTCVKEEEDMDTAAFSKLKISDGPSGEHSNDTALSSANQLNQQVNQSVQSCGDGQALTEESIMLVSDESRLNAVADLLNTKQSQDTMSPTMEPVATNVPPSSLQPYYMCVIEEPPDKKEAASGHITELIKSYEQTEGKSIDSLISDSGKKSGKASNKESYEKAELKHGDKIFHKFLKRLQRYPSQCVRYERGGCPLLVKPLDTSHTAVQPCPYCGGQRVFELQLLPPLICSLRLKDGSPSPVEFGTVLIFTCENNCWSTGDTSCDLNPKEEFIMLQSDPDEHLFR